MNHDDFENQLRRQPLRTPPAEWREEVLRAAQVEEHTPLACVVRRPAGQHVPRSSLWLRWSGRFRRAAEHVFGVVTQAFQPAVSPTCSRQGVASSETRPVRPRLRPATSRSLETCDAAGWKACATLNTDAAETRTRAACAPHPISWWRELIWPSPVAWTAVAAVWVAVFALHLNTPRPPRSVALKKTRSPASVSMAFAEQRAWLNQVLQQPSSPVPSAPPISRPRTERLRQTFIA